MDYELARQLKDTGFPESEGWYETPEYPGIFVCNVAEGRMTVPTLSELIAACVPLCSEEFQLTDWKDKWVASEEVYYDDAGYQDRIGEGKTPEEAVAKLWLALHKK